MTMQDSSAAEEAGPILNASALEHIRALQRPGAPSVLGRVITIYLESSPGLLQALHGAVSAGDAGALLDSAHSLKSSSANLGAMQLSNVCRELENLGREGNTEAAGFLLKRLDTEYQAVQNALHSELQALSNACCPS